MKLSNQSKDELRKKIIEQLKEVPKGQRVHLDRELLEELVFETIPDKDYEGKEMGKFKKTIVWSNPFLSKIDLSELSFDNVDWNYDYRQTGINIDLSNTNVKIDFSKAFANDDDDIFVSNCNFANVDLSNSHAEEITMITDCNFSNTSANIFGERSQDRPINLMRCDFSNNDFSKIEIDSYYFYGDNGEIEDCNFSNTGLKIKYFKPSISFSEESKMYDEFDKFQEFFKSGKSLSSDQEDEYERINKTLRENEQILECAYRLSQHIKAGFLAGCYVNGKLIHSKEESQEIAQAIKEEYEQMKNSLISSTIGSIEEQVSHMKR